MNDDYCGLGTGARKGSPFFCLNVGRLGASTPATRVNDGSDEPSGLRPNICAEVGVRHRVLLEQEAKLRKSVCFPLFISRIPPQFGTYLGLRNPRILRRFRQEGEGPSWWSHQFRQTGSRRAY